MTAKPGSLQTALIRWTEAHALLMAVAITLAWLHGPLYASALIAGLSFAGLAWQCRGHWTAAGKFGAANAITLLRLLATLALLAIPHISYGVIVAAALAILSLDGLDGWVARKTGLSSEFGDYFDKEADAFFMLALCLLLYAAGHLGPWILLPGSLRYGFVWFLRLAEPPLPKEQPTRLTKAIAVVMLSTLVFCFLPFPHGCETVAVTTTVALVCSFGWSIWRLYRPSLMTARVPLRTRPVRRPEDIRAFFDQLANGYRDYHGQAAKLLNYRLEVINGLLGPGQKGVLLEIGCGAGMHLFALAHRFTQARGTDLSSAMIAQAERARRCHPHSRQITFAVDPAETLGTVGEGEIDVALCVGAFEHMPNKSAVLRQIRRVLKPGGTFICLTPNGAYCWYAAARWLGMNTKHLSTDCFLSKSELRALLESTALIPERLGYWTFIPRGDMPRLAANLMGALDQIGRWFGVARFRGGLFCKATKPAVSR